MLTGTRSIAETHREERAGGGGGGEQGERERETRD